MERLKKGWYFWSVYEHPFTKRPVAELYLIIKSKGDYVHALKLGNRQWDTAIKFHKVPRGNEVIPVVPFTTDRRYFRTLDDPEAQSIFFAGYLRDVVAENAYNLLSQLESTTSVEKLIAVAIILELPIPDPIKWADKEGLMIKRSKKLNDILNSYDPKEQIIRYTNKVKYQSEQYYGIMKARASWMKHEVSAPEDRQWVVVWDKEKKRARPGQYYKELDRVEMETGEVIRFEYWTFDYPEP